MLTDDQRAILENAADLLEEQGHAGCTLVREIVRKLPDPEPMGTLRPFIGGPADGRYYAVGKRSTFSIPMLVPRPNLADFVPSSMEIANYERRRVVIQGSDATWEVFMFVGFTP